MVIVALALGISAPAQVRNAGGRPLHNEAERAAPWKTVPMAFHRERLNGRELQMIAKLADACRLMDQLYWQQSDLGGWAMLPRKAIRGHGSPLSD